MRFTIDENVPLLVASALISLGHDCFLVAQQAHQAIDPDIMAFSRRENRVLVTFDSDFSRMIFHELQPPPAGVVFMRGRPDEATMVSELFLTMFRGDLIDLDRRFIVIDPSGDVRSLPLETNDNG